MSWLSDIAGGGAQQAATAQETGLLAGMDWANQYLNQNPGIINNLYGQADQPFQQNLQTANTGVSTYAPQVSTAQNNLYSLLGMNGGNPQAALASTPGYQFALDQGNNSVNAAAAANGTLNSGNQLTALAKYDTGLADQTYQSAVGNAATATGVAQNSLNPYLALLTPNATGNANVLTGQSGALTGNNNLLAQLAQSTYSGIGNAQGSADLRQGAGDASLLSGAIQLGSSLLGSAVSGGLGGITGGLSGLFGGGSAGVGGLVDNAAFGDSALGGSLFG
jgi:hypothetical protein